ncbi:hypothetical protein FACS189418_4010 [Clostridia bacterium]|nr:hypothetical protein FACS189418_4010 [Clostridia bacterium]
MGEIHYLISDASKKVDVEAHVLRYWEEELEIEIPRNELGHRYYTDEIVNLFCKIKLLKEKGYQLKVIKSHLCKLRQEEEFDHMENILESISGEGAYSMGNLVTQTVVSQHMNQNQVLQAVQEQSVKVVEQPIQLVEQPMQEMANEDKMHRFQEIMAELISQSLEKQTEKISENISTLVSERVKKDLEYYMKEREEKEEERYRKLDETLRFCQKGYKGKAEAAITFFPNTKVKKKKRFGRSGNKLF